MKKLLSIALALLMMLPFVSLLSYASETVIYTYSEAAEYIRDRAKDRENTISFDYRGGDFTETPLDEIFAYIPGDEEAGDYLRYSTSSISDPVTAEDGTVTLNLTYYTTLEQENELDNALFGAEGEFDMSDFDEKSDYEKVSAIFDYIKDNVKYDAENYFDDTQTLKYTAYSAVINKKAICQGYSLLFEKLALKSDLDARIVCGYKDGENHAWNIVKLDDKWYYIDCTYAAEFEQWEDYFLKSDLPGTEISYEENFTCSEIADYDFAELPYTLPGHNYTFTQTVAGNCINFGYDLWTCSDCGKTFKTNYTPVTDHVYDDDYDTDCNFCGLTRNLSIGSYDDIRWVYNEDTQVLRIDGPETLKITTEVNTRLREFDECTELVIGEGVTYIQNGGFVNIESTTALKNVKKITFPSTLLQIHGTYFKYVSECCEELVFPENLNYIGGSNFTNCKALKTLILPEALTTINPHIFSNCYNLKEVYIPKNVKKIYGTAFSSSPGIEKFSVAEENQYYSTDEYGVLFNKDKTVLLKYPAGSAYTEYTIPSTVREIETYAFSCCDKLTSITIPDGVNAIGDCAFYRCDALTELNFPEGLTEIADQTFWYCSNLKTVYFPKTLETFSWSSFYTCNNLQNIIVAEGNTCFSTDEKGILYNYDKTELLWCPHDMFSERAIDIPESVTSIGSYAFYDCILLNINLPEGLQSIGSYAFYGCAYLEKIDIPSTVQTIEGYAFCGCDKLKEITIPENVSTLGSEVLSGCSNLETVTIKNSECDIGYIPENSRIIGYKNSTAETYATENNIEFVDIECAHENTLETAEVPSTCIDTGYTAGVYCTDCSSYISGHNIIQKISHVDADTDGICDLCGLSPDCFTSGRCGKNLLWSYDDSNLMTISGTGESYSENHFSSWGKYIKKIKNVYVKPGVTSLDGNLFALGSNINAIFVSEDTAVNDCQSNCIHYSVKDNTLYLRAEKTVRYNIYQLLNMGIKFAEDYDINAICINNFSFVPTGDDDVIKYDILHNGKRISESAFTLGKSDVLTDVTFSIRGSTFNEFAQTDIDSLKSSLYLDIDCDDLLPESLRENADEYSEEILLYFVDEAEEEESSAEEPEEEENVFKVIFERFSNLVHSVLTVFKRLLKLLK